VTDRELDVKWTVLWSAPRCVFTAEVAARCGFRERQGQCIHRGDAEEDAEIAENTKGKMRASE